LLDGMQLAAAAWEPEVLALRVKDYTPQWLDQLCLTGRIGWGRLSPPQHPNSRASTPLRSTPISVFARENLARWFELSGRPAPAGFGPDTEMVLRGLSETGAMFFSELVRTTKLLPSRVAQALGELTARGWVTADSFEGLRALLLPSEKRAPFAEADRRRRHKTVTSVEFAGRGSLLRKPPLASPESEEEPPRAGDEAMETFARILLGRYGIVFRRLLERESLRVSWYELGRCYRRLEAHGEIRGGHFVNGAGGEQFALPEAIGLLRSVRKAAPAGELIVINATDPLNLLGILASGPRVAAITANRILLRDGRPIAVLNGGAIERWTEVGGHDAAAVEQALLVGQMAPALRPYYA
jgi:ATP-dependent Lhr-like helicase